MSKHKTVAIRLIAAIAMLCAAIAMFFGAAFAYADEVTEVMEDPTYEMIAFGAGDSMKIMSDGTVQGNLAPTTGFGGRANSNGLGEASRYSIADGVSITIKNLTISAEACFTVAMQTVSTGTIGQGNGGGVHVGFRVIKEGGGYNFRLIVWNNATSVQWAPEDAYKVLDAENPVWTAETVNIFFSREALRVSFQGATGGDFAEVTLNEAAGFGNLFDDFADDDVSPADGIYHSTKPYLSFSCYNANQGQKTGNVTFNLAEVNGKTPASSYQEALNAQIAAFIDAVETAGDGADQDKVDAAVALNVFGDSQPYGKLLAQYGTEEQKTAVAEARDKIVELNGDAIFAELKGQIEAFTAALDAYDLDDPATHTAAAEAYNAIDWSLYESLNDGFRGQIDELVAAMKEKTFFKSAIYDVFSATIEKLETATAAEFASSDGYLSVKASVDGWAQYKADNYFEDLADAKKTELEERMAAVKGKLEASFYHGFIYRGTESKVQLYDEGLYLSVKPDVYPATDNAVSFQEKMTLGVDSEIRFNLIYGLRKLGAFQMQIGFYPVAGAMTKGDTDGVRVDFWLSEQNVTQIKPVNGRTEESICGDAMLSLPDEEFFDFEADELDYTQSDYTVKLAANDDGTLSIFVNDLEMVVEDEAFSADLFKDGVYITVTGCGYAGTANNELLVTKIGSTEYVELDDGGSDPVTPPDDGGDSDSCGSCGGSIDGVSALAAAALLLACAAYALGKKRN